MEHLDRRWKKELKLAGIRCFHTTDNAHLRGEFDGKPRVFADQLYRSLIELIAKHACGAAVVYTMPEHKFSACLSKLGYWAYSQYTTCAYLCVMTLMKLARRLDDEHVRFSIESGHKDMRELDTLLGEVAGAGVRFTYDFRPKDSVRPLQTADVWAYEAGKRVRDPNRPLRKSLEAIIAAPFENRVMSLDESSLRKLMERYQGLMLT